MLKVMLNGALGKMFHATGMLTPTKKFILDNYRQGIYRYNWGDYFNSNYMHELATRPEIWAPYGGRVNPVYYSGRYALEHQVDYLWTAKAAIKTAALKVTKAIFFL